MWKEGKTLGNTENFIHFTRRLFSRCFHIKRKDSPNQQIFNVDSTSYVDIYFLELIFVVISFTVSAKAGSERIFCSTFLKELMMVA